MQNHIYFADNLAILKSMPAASIDLIYIDPPFNTGKVQSRTQLKTEQSSMGDRKGFSGRNYQTKVLSERAYNDRFDDYMAFLRPRLQEAYRILEKKAVYIFILIIEKYIIVKLCWMRSLVESAFLMRLFGLMIMEVDPKIVGPQSMTIYFFT